MKGNRPVGPAKTPVRIPPDAIASDDHLSAVAAFERWQRELPKAAAFATNDHHAKMSATSEEALKH